MTDTTKLKTYTRETEFRVSITPENNSSLLESDKKDHRSELFRYPKEGLNYELFDNLKAFNLLHLNQDPNSKKKNYQGDLEWDIEGLTSLSMISRIDVNRLERIINPNDNIAYEEAESPLMVIQTCL